jgi:hypothetical protein
MSETCCGRFVGGCVGKECAVAALEKRLEAAEAVVEYLKYLDGPENYSFPGIHRGPELDQLIERLAAYDQLKEREGK